MHPLSIYIPLLLNLSLALSFSLPHPNPDSIANEVQMQLNSSRSRYLLQQEKDQCLTGNPIDDCWRCSGVDWRTDRMRLADCGIGFGRNALGGRGGQTYVVTDPSDRDPVNPAPGTLRYAAIQDGPLWITFASDMAIRLSVELLVNSFKTIDGRGANVHIAGGACITVEYVSNIIIHNIYVHDCVPAGNANVRSSPTHYGFRSKSDGDGMSLHSASNVWIDHCSLARCTDGLIDATRGSTGITISNNYFSHHDKVMLLGHTDDYLPDSGMQVTVAFNHFGEALGQRMPRCRRGYFHVVNNDYTQWEMYAVGGSANPTINSQGNRYTAPSDMHAKEVTKRIDTDKGEWQSWNWRTEGDIMVNGAFFVASGAGLEATYAKAESVEPRSAVMIDQLTMNAGVLGGPRQSAGTGYPGTGGGDGGGTGGGTGGGDGGGTGGADGGGTGGGTGGGDGGGTGGGGEGYGYTGMGFGSSTTRSSIPQLSSSFSFVLFFLLCLHPFVDIGQNLF